MSLGLFVQVNGSDKSGVDTHASVCGGTVQTQKYTFGKVRIGQEEGLVDDGTNDAQISEARFNRHGFRFGTNHIPMSSNEVYPV